MSGYVRLAMIGCGAVAEHAHLPAGATLRGGGFSLLVDLAEPRRTALAHRFGVPHTAAVWTDAADQFDAAIVALPHSLHESVCVALLRAGKHVLVEKPLACTVREAEAIVAAAAESNALLGVGLQRRHGWAPRFAKQLIESGTLGNIESFDFQEGGVYDWPVASDFFFRKESAGGGVLMDTGAHTLDLLHWWLGDYASVDCATDAAGGVEADCELQLRLQSGAHGRVTLSRARRLRNTAIIHGSRASLEVGMHVNSLKLRTRDGLELGGEIFRSSMTQSQYYPHLMAEQLQQFVTSAAHRRDFQPSGASALPSVRLIEEAYRHVRPLEYSWAKLTPDTPA